MVMRGTKDMRTVLPLMAKGTSLLGQQVLNQIKTKLDLLHAPNTTGRPYREMLTYKPLTNNAVQERVKKIFTK